MSCAINRAVPTLKLYLLYGESDFALIIAYNILAGGTYPGHIAVRRNDGVYLDALTAPLDNLHSNRA